MRILHITLFDLKTIERTKTHEIGHIDQNIDIRCSARVARRYAHFTRCSRQLSRLGKPDTIPAILISNNLMSKY